MKKQELLKLAEIAGEDVKWSDDCSWQDGCLMIQREDHDYSYWRPDEDLNQAFEIIESLESIVDIEINKIRSKGVVVYLYGPVVGGNTIPWPKESYRGEGESLAEAICKAVLKVEKTLNQSTQRLK